MRARRAATASIAAIAASAALLVTACRTTPPEPAQPGSEVAPTPGRATIVGALDFGVLPEASGMVVSRRRDDLLWLVNDQGNPAELVALETRDMGTRRVTVSAARNRDWEDLAAFTLDGAPWLVIADVGDNRAVRDTVGLYFVPEPEPGSSGTAPALGLTFAYEDGPRDVEAVAVDTGRDAIFLLSKRTTPPVLYRLPLRASLAAARRGDSAIAARVGPVTSIPEPSALELRLFPKYGKYRNQPTAMDLSADGTAIVLLTYGEAYRVRLAPGRTWLDALNGELEPLGMPVLAQPETIAWDGAGGIYASSEQRGAPLIHWAPHEH